MKKLFLLFTFFILLTGCISVGNKKVMQATERAKIKVGQTMIEVKAILGKPRFIKKESDGKITYIYFGAKMGLYARVKKSASLSVKFNKNNKVEYISEVEGKKR